MNDQSPHRLRHHWLGWIAMLAFASVLSPINIHIVIAQDAPEVVVAAADPGEPPAPARAAEMPATQEIATTVAAEPTRAAVDLPPVDVPAVSETEAQASALPAPPSEVNNDADFGKLIPVDETQAQAIDSGRAKADPDSVRTLSVEPGLRTILPADRPAWVGAAPDYTSDQHHLYVGSSPTTDEAAADEALDEPLIAAVRNYIDQEVVNEQGAASKMPIDAAFIRRNLIDDPSGYVCELSTSQGSMFQKWVTLRVTPEQRKQFAIWHIEASQRKRVTALGLGLVSVLALVSLSHMVLRRHGASPLPFVNPQAAEPAPVVRRSRSWTAFKVLGFLMFLMIPAFLVLASLIFAVSTDVVRGPVPVDRSHQSRRHLPYEIQLPDLHKEVRIETLDGQHRTIILESKSHR